MEVEALARSFRVLSPESAGTVGFVQRRRRPRNPSAPWNRGFGTVLGIGVGTAFAAALDSVAVGVGLGATFTAALVVMPARQRDGVPPR